MLNQPSHYSMVNWQSISHMSFKGTFECAQQILKLLYRILSGAIGSRPSYSRMLRSCVGDVACFATVAESRFNGGNNSRLLIRSVGDLGNTFVLEETLKAIHGVKIHRTFAVTDCSKERLAWRHTADENGQRFLIVLVAEEAIVGVEYWQCTPSGLRQMVAIRSTT